MSLVHAGWNLQLNTVISLHSHFCLMQLLKYTSGSHCAMGSHKNHTFVPHMFYGDDLCGMIEKRVVRDYTDSKRLWAY